MSQIFKCGPCGREFPSDEDYCAHSCSAAADEVPTSIAYLVNTTTPNFAEISLAAQERGTIKQTA